MKLVRKLDQYRRDFQGEYICQGCGTVSVDEGLYSYDDDNFHDNVIPDMKCRACGKSANDMKIENERIATKYSADEVV